MKLIAIATPAAIALLVSAAGPLAAEESGAEASSTIEEVVVRRLAKARPLRFRFTGAGGRHRRGTTSSPPTATPIWMILSRRWSRRTTSPRNQSATRRLSSARRRFAPCHRDATLVLLNGARGRHRAAVIALLGAGISGGSPRPPTYRPIPAIALDRLEVLRDGAIRAVRVGRHCRDHELRTPARIPRDRPLK